MASGWLWFMPPVAQPAGSATRVEVREAGRGHSEVTGATG